MDKKCTYCGAQKFKNETPGMCCACGKVKLPDLRSPPEPLLTLVSGKTSQWKFFLKNIRKCTDLHIFKRGSVTAIRYRDEVLESIVRLCAAAVGPTFVLMDNNARPHRAVILDDYLKRRDCAYVVSSRFPPPATH
ncbi:transposable element Tcb1 transposase [Trichonephila clavipes]|uniref:Transposable element Tcb1 transposase n=1 Tax=Trichonephila clavipes TaxID=2585209 RepID=A0A8X6SC84_TRICX|nr:transposable element Tcb1 transposase [Trichonephila clavipes]